MTYPNTLLEPLFRLIQYSADNPAAGRGEALTDEAVERMPQQGVLSSAQLNRDQSRNADVPFGEIGGQF